MVNFILYVFYHNKKKCKTKVQNPTTYLLLCCPLVRDTATSFLRIILRASKQIPLLHPCCIIDSSQWSNWNDPFKMSEHSRTSYVQNLQCLSAPWEQRLKSIPLSWPPSTVWLLHLCDLLSLPHSSLSPMDSLLLLWDTRHVSIKKVHALG